jgi:hypothetical protein
VVKQLKSLRHSRTLLRNPMTSASPWNMWNKHLKAGSAAATSHNLQTADARTRCSGYSDGRRRRISRSMSRKAGMGAPLHLPPPPLAAAVVSARKPMWDDGWGGVVVVVLLLLLWCYKFKIMIWGRTEGREQWTRGVDSRWGVIWQVGSPDTRW